MSGKNPFKTLNRFEWLLWICSNLIIIVSFLLGKEFDLLVLTASLIGATALIFVSKGNPFGQIMTVVFAVFYAVISYRFKYYGEMITYLGMTSPMAIAATVEWFKNPFEKGKSEVKIKKLTRKGCVILWGLTVVVTFAFYFILKVFDTPNLFFSTVSIATSFLASGLTFLRNPYYALAYAGNDIVLIILWILASIAEPENAPMIICFIIFFINDSYGFINWKKMRKRQGVQSEKIK